MEILEIGSFKLEFDSHRTRSFYTQQDGFTCTCRDCKNYVVQIPKVISLLQGLDEKLGIDLYKDVGQGMDELMPHDNEDHILYLIPYYINGKCLINDKNLTIQQNGPIWQNTIRVEHKIDDCLNLVIINTTESIEFKNAKSVLSIWLEFKTPLIVRDTEVKSKSLWRKIKNLISK